MSNSVSNSFKIYCEDPETMNKIKMMIYDENDKATKHTTVTKILFSPKSYVSLSQSSQYPWCESLSDTKWDIYDYKISENGKTITIQYYTRSSPNYGWVKAFCKFIERTLLLNKPQNTTLIKIEHKYYDNCMDYGGILEWTPGTKCEYKEYEFKEYTRLYDQYLYNWILDLEKTIGPRGFVHFEL